MIQIDSSVNATRKIEVYEVKGEKKYNEILIRGYDDGNKIFEAWYDLIRTLVNTSISSHILSKQSGVKYFLGGYNPSIGAFESGTICIEFKKIYVWEKNSNVPIKIGKFRRHYTVNQGRTTLKVRENKLNGNTWIKQFDNSVGLIDIVNGRFWTDAFTTDGTKDHFVELCNCKVTYKGDPKLEIVNFPVIDGRKYKIDCDGLKAICNDGFLSQVPNEKEFFDLSGNSDYANIALMVDDKNKKKETIHIDKVNQDRTFSMKPFKRQKGKIIW